MANRILDVLPHQDSRFFRYLHMLIAFLILAQIINSNLTHRKALGQFSLAGIVTWLHIISGFATLMLGIIMLCWMLSQRGFRYYFSWLCLDFRGIRQDLRTLFSLRLPDAHPGGIAASVQGLGVVSLHAVAVCGGLWFVLITFDGANASLAHQVLHLHKSLTLYIETYFWAHAAMGILHMFLTFRSQQQP